MDDDDIPQDNQEQEIQEEQEAFEAQDAPAYCTHCGNTLLPDAAFCARCGTPIDANALVPVYTPHWVMPPPAPEKTGGDAVAALAFGIFSLVSGAFGVVGMPFAIVGIVLGVIARKRYARRNSNYNMATGGMICSFIALVLACIAIIACFSFLAEFNSMMSAIESCTDACYYC